jgi:hypothetical protein
VVLGKPGGNFTREVGSSLKVDLVRSCERQQTRSLPRSDMT